MQILGEIHTICVNGLAEMEKHMFLFDRDILIFDIIFITSKTEIILKQRKGCETTRGYYTHCKMEVLHSTEMIGIYQVGCVLAWDHQCHWRCANLCQCSDIRKYALKELDRIVWGLNTGL